MSNLPMHIALVSEIDARKIPFSELAMVSAAISTQVVRDFGPIWGVSATVDPFPTLRDVPPGYWPVTIKDDIDDPGVVGFHTDKNGNPLALVQFGPGWSLSASHEVLEILADPFGNRVVASSSPNGDNARVEILVEVCDPSQDATFSYTINGVTVSDFYTPQYLDPVTTPGVRYGYTKALTQARQVLEGGYISYHDLQDDQWKQLTFFDDSGPQVRVIGSLSAATGRSIRAQIDRIVAGDRSAALAKSKALSTKFQSRMSTTFAFSTELRKSVDASSDAKAAMWRGQFAELYGAHKPGEKKAKKKSTKK